MRISVKDIPEDLDYLDEYEDELKLEEQEKRKKKKLKKIKKIKENDE